MSPSPPRHQLTEQSSRASRLPGRTPPRGLAAPSENGGCSSFPARQRFGAEAALSSRQRRSPSKPPAFFPGRRNRPGLRGTGRCGQVAAPLPEPPPCWLPGQCPAPEEEKAKEEELLRGTAAGRGQATPSRIMWQSRQNIVKLSGLLLASLLAWYMGYLFAGLLSEDSMSTPITYLQDIGKKPVLKAPVPKRQKCDHWSPCLPGNYAYRVRSGGGRENLAKICFEDELIISEEKGNVGRGINIAIVNYKTGKMISAKFFDMWEGEHSAEMATFIKNAPQGSLLLMVTHDDGSTRLKSDAKTLIEALGSKEIQNMKFRSSWAFIAAKGFKLPDDIQTEKINHSDNKKNRYSGWPAEIVIEGCIPRNLI